MTNTKLTYTQQGDYLLPDLELPEQPKVKIRIVRPDEGRIV
ncbi:MAG: hypothetical protein UH239_07630 [Acutalibacteraceae bacterium]|nr:hypothetical protein [Acutalibacteraceae bacterium]